MDYVSTAFMYVRTVCSSLHMYLVPVICTHYLCTGILDVVAPTIYVPSGCICTHYSCTGILHSPCVYTGTHVYALRVRLLRDCGCCSCQHEEIMIILFTAPFSTVNALSAVSTPSAAEFPRSLFYYAAFTALALACMNEPHYCILLCVAWYHDVSTHLCNVLPC